MGIPALKERPNLPQPVEVRRRGNPRKKKVSGTFSASIRLARPMIPPYQCVLPEKRYLTPFPPPVVADR